MFGKIAQSMTLLIMTLALAACGSPEPAGDDTVSGDVIAEQLDEAASQSRPGAKAVLEQAASEAATHEQDRKSVV